MGWFETADKKEATAAYWKTINSMAELNTAVQESEHVPIIIFKHSTRCGISTSALKRLETDWPIDKSTASAYYLDLLRHRDISNAIADQFGVRHESPQVLIIKDGQCVYDASHGQIDSDEIRKQL